MSWQQDLTTLLNVPAVNAIVDGRVDRFNIQEGTQLPAVSFQLESNEVKNTFDGARWHYLDVQIHCYSVDGDELITLKKAVHEAIVGKQEGGLKDIFLIDELEDQETKTRAARSIQIFRMAYKLP